MMKTRILAILSCWLIVGLFCSYSLATEEIQEKVVSVPETVKNVTIKGLFQVELSITTDKPTLTIASEASNLVNILVDADDETLSVYTRGRIQSKIMKPKIVIKIPQLVAYTASGTVDSVLHVNTRDLLTIQIAGVSKVDLYGYADTLSIDVSGTSKVHADTLNVSEATVQLKGVSSAYFKRSTKVSQNVSGVSKVYLLD